MALVVTMAGAARGAPEAPAIIRPEELRLQGDARFASGDYQTALRFFQRAWDLGHEPLDLFRLGRSQFKLGAHGPAKDALFKFMQLAPAAEETTEAFAIVGQIEKSEEERARLTPPPGPPGRTWTWVAGGAGVASVATGLVFGLQSKSTANEIKRSEHSGAQVSSLNAQLKSQAQRGNLFLGIGAALLLVSGTLFVLHF
jgi:hypothetical protein